MLKDMEEGKRSRCGVMQEESKQVIERGLHRQREVEKVIDSRMKIASPVFSKAK